jgi:colicin import membrane protein
MRRCAVRSCLVRAAVAVVGALAVVSCARKPGPETDELKAKLASLEGRVNKLEERDLDLGAEVEALRAREAAARRADEQRVEAVAARKAEEVAQRTAEEFVARAVAGLRAERDRKARPEGAARPRGQGREPRKKAAPEERARKKAAEIGEAAGLGREKVQELAEILLANMREAAEVRRSSKAGDVSEEEAAEKLREAQRRHRRALAEFAENLPEDQRPAFEKKAGLGEPKREGEPKRREGGDRRRKGRKREREVEAGGDAPPAE